MRFYEKHLRKVLKSHRKINSVKIIEKNTGQFHKFDHFIIEFPCDPFKKKTVNFSGISYFLNLCCDF
jgi:hypothetical protein